MRCFRRRRRQHGGSLPNRLAVINFDVICTFHRGEEGFNGIRSIKTGIYYRLGWLWFAAISKWTQDYGRTRSTFQNKPQVSLSNIRPVPTGSPDPRDSFIYINMRNTSEAVLPEAIILTKAHRATVSMMAKGCFASKGNFFCLLPICLHI